MYETIIEKIKERLTDRELSVVIIPHISPDGDAAGSCSALWQVLDKVGIQAQLMTCDYIPDYLKWLKRIPDAISFQNRPKECKQWLRKADVLFMLDHNAVAREGDYVHEQLYQRNTLSRLRLTGNCLLNKLAIDEHFPVATIPITFQELELYNYKDGDLEGLVNIPLSIEEVLVSIQITERKDKVKLSFRSKGNIPVNLWAKEFFNGGGHLNAAGGQMPLPLDDVVKKVRDTAEWFFKAIKN